MSYDPNVIMKRAESFFDKESYAEAIVEYKHFLDLHQNHTLAPYAQYKIGVSHYKQFRTVDRDPEPLNKAISGFERLLKNFPASRYEAEAKETILTCKGQLVQRHLMVGEFYYKRGSYLAAAHRYEKIINEFPELETTGEAMFEKPCFSWRKPTRNWELKNGLNNGLSRSSGDIQAVPTTHRLKHSWHRFRKNIPLCSLRFPKIPCYKKTLLLFLPLQIPHSP
jgi:tetratricopeptide (TPR) repeat protein